MGSVSQDFFLSTLFLSLSRPLNRTVTMMFLPRLPLLLAIIFLGLFCLPHTNRCSADPNCVVYEGRNSEERADNEDRLCDTLSRAGFNANNRKCEKDGKICSVECDTSRLVVKD